MRLLRFPHLIMLSSFFLVVLLVGVPSVPDGRADIFLTITLSPTFGRTTSTVQVSGTNFGSNEQVDMYFDTTAAAAVSTNSQGLFLTSFRVPATSAQGMHMVSAVGRTSKLSTQASFLVQANWAQFRYAPRNTGNNPYEIVLSPGNVAHLKVSWSLQVAGSERTTPAVVGGVAYVAGGNMYALNATTGTQIWSAPIGANTSPAVVNGVVYVGSPDKNVYALNATTGTQIWVSTAGGMQSSPAVEKDVVYTGSTNGKVRAFKAGTGVMLWSATAGSRIDDLPTIANGVVYSGANDGRLHAFNATTGVQLWSTSIGTDLYSSPSTANGVVYVGSDNAKIYALNAQTGAILWSYTTEAFIGSSPAVVNGMVYIGSDDRHMYAFALAGFALKGE